MANQGPDRRRTDRTLPRPECYDKIRNCMENNLRAYYQLHPDRLLDERSQQKVEMMRLTLKCILEILDGYEIERVNGKDTV